MLLGVLKKKTKTEYIYLYTLAYAPVVNAYNQYKK